MRPRRERGSMAATGRALAPAGADDEGSTTMATIETTAARWAARLLVRLAALGSLALLLGGLAAAPAAAQTRDDAVTQANDLVSWCLLKGGDPDVWIDASGTVVAVCHF